MNKNWKIVEQVKQDLRNDTQIDECVDCYDYAAISCGFKNVKVKDLVKEVEQ